MKYLLALATLLLFSVKAIAQDKIPFIDLDDIYEQLSSGDQDEDYKKNVELLNTISKNDSSYCDVLVSKSYYLLNSNQYDKAIATIDEGLGLDCDGVNLSFYINKGLTLTLMEEYTKAVEVYNTALKRYPKNAELWFNKGLAYEKAGQLERAIEDYKASIRLKPTYGRPHLQLGNICYKQERMTQALMCFNVYLLLIIDEDNAFSILQSLNNVVGDRNENEVNPDFEISPDDEAFDELDLILNNRIALNQKYKTGHKIEIALTKQNHALLQQINEVVGNGGFWDQKYIPLYKWIADNGLFENFIYTLCYPIENEKYAKAVKSNEKGIVDFIGKFYDKWRDIMKTDTQEFEGETQEVINYYYNNYTQAVGKMNGETSVGKWYIYNEDGQLSSEGNYDENGERDGKWTWYHPNGGTMETAVYQNGKLNGENLHFFENGKPYIVTAFKDDELEGEYLLYNEKGALIEKKFFKAGELDGLYKSYFKVGESLLEWHIPYKKGDVESMATEYYANGDVYAEIPFENGKRHGVEKKFHYNKKPSSEISYANGELNGPYKLYHSNGNLWKEGVSADNFYNGPFKIYYRDGTLERDQTYNNGNLEGESKYYDRDGKLHYEYLYRKSEVIAYKYFDKEGHVIKEARKKGGEFEFKGFTPQGTKLSEGLYDIKGGKKGLWKFYSNNGVLTNKGEYDDNKAIGKHINYHNNGEIKSIEQYVNDSLSGYYVGYHPNGQMEQQGWYKKNEAQGEWRIYYMDGTLKEINFYHNGELHGKQEIFAVDGKLERTYVYKTGKLFSEVYFDDQGNALGEINYRQKENDFTLTYVFANGKTDITVNYINGIKHGKYASYDYYGNILLQGQYNNGEMDGEWTWYYANGNKSLVKQFRDGTLHGEYLDYHDNGKLDEKHMYVWGKREGKSVAYFETGVQSHETNYEYGELHGKKYFYDSSGKLQLIRIYEYGRLIGYSYLGTNGKEVPMIPLEIETGKIKAYFDNGKVSREMEYKNGDLVGAYKEYYYSGQLESEMTYQADEFDGVLTTYYENGTKKGTYNYQYGVLQGLVTKYHENGNLQEEVNYVNDSRNGARKYYDNNGKLTKEEYYFNGDVYKSKTF
ncbi:tetratricopeptide repeat protein [Hyunsoonleella sp. SJ7]|uniref:Tetratricopeptide repeat protein n=1 Tax=Hyunsoonleella aquatilis TaxID=2762758 RepID=A0A923HE60_9FLAO|nr:toxin-antitoxin system YwqK family antitoxin [Hyunsoonleella aquatilis]MBC3756827.1 tetratricopeptide repeat protein [Hyunsoonleella aquatilis]